MHCEQIQAPNLTAPFTRVIFDKKENTKLPGFSNVIINKDSESKRLLLFRLQEMEKHNHDLKNIVSQQDQKLSEIVETNNKFISILAHDLRGPFGTILGVLSILKESLKDFNMDEIKSFIDLASGSTNRTLNLLDNLLAWTISQSKARSFNPVKINLHELLMYEIESIQSSATQKQISLQYSIQPDLNTTADLQMIKTILRNLISNAVKYTNSDGEITVNASKNKSCIKVSIKDNGIGISNKTKKNLFKMDSIQSTAGTNNEVGTGLGLLLCKEFIEMHGGNLHLESEKDKGSEFKFTIPLN